MVKLVVPVNIFLVDVLKKKWGFNGFLTSDYGALVDIYKYHKLCETDEEAAAMTAKGRHES